MLINSCPQGSQRLDWNWAYTSRPWKPKKACLQKVHKFFQRPDRFNPEEDWNTKRQHQWHPKNAVRKPQAEWRSVEDGSHALLPPEQPCAPECRRRCVSIHCSAGAPGWWRDRPGPAGVAAAKAGVWPVKSGDDIDLQNHPAFEEEQKAFQK